MFCRVVRVIIDTFHNSITQKRVCGLCDQSDDLHHLKCNHVICTQCIEIQEMYSYVIPCFQCCSSIENVKRLTKLKTPESFLQVLTKTTMTQNIYTNLHVDDESVDKGTEHMQRKAEKKLKEIERLKTKPNLTPEEVEKINTEKKWKHILHIFDPEPPEKTEKSKKRKRKPKQKPPKQRHFAHIELSVEFSKQQTIQDEFEDLFCKNNNVDKTFRQLSIKYHPDKNPDKKQWAETMQKELGGVRDAYTKRQ